MTKTLARNFLALTALAGLFSITAIPSAVADDPGVPPQVVPCFVGGAQESVNGTTRNFPTVTASALPVLMLNTTILGGGSGAAGTTDLYILTFSGEASATGGGSWLAQAQYNVNGGAFLPMNPVGPNTFHSGNAAQTHTMTWCKRIEASNVTNFRIIWSKVGGGTAIIDDYLTKVERSD
jgi:hypothetical protein